MSSPPSQKKIPGPLEKKCSSCTRVLPLGWFSKNGDRLRSQCRDCMKPKRSMDAAKRRKAGSLYIAKGLIQRLFVRQLGACGICALPIVDRTYHVDHIRPIARGGLHEEKNLQLAHPRCNLRKGAKMELHTRLKLK